LATFFADGTVLPADPACDVDGAPVAIGPGATAADFEANWQFELNLDAYLAQDIASLVRQLGQLNETHPRFAGRLQVRNVGAFGHSFCGSHAFRAARDLPEIAAAANLDGTVFNENAAEGVRKPYLMIGGLDTHPSTSDIQLAIAQYQALGLTADEAALQVSRALPGATFLASRPAYPVTIPSAQHMNFSDVGLWAAYGIPVDADPVNLSGAQAIVGLQNSMLTRFFDLNLRGIGGELSLPASSLAGLTLEARR
jgi:pimeloyl-ACP methyl ester carboxylesterase